MLQKNMNLTKATLMLRAWSWMNVRMIAWCLPKIVEMTDQRVSVKIPLNRRTRNHQRAMYIGTLVAGSDVAAGFLALKTIREENSQVSLIFKNMRADFFKRAEGDTVFVCDEGDKVRSLVYKTLETGERQTEEILVRAYCPEKLGDACVAEFGLSLSLKKK